MSEYELPELEYENAKYPDVDEVDTSNVLPVQVDSFLNYMADKLRRQALGLPEPKVEGAFFTKEEIKEHLPELYDPMGAYGPKDIFEAATRTRFELMPEGVQATVLDKLFGCLRPDEQQIDLVSIHILHSLSKLGNDVREVVYAWLTARRPLLDVFRALELQGFFFRSDVKTDINEPWDLDTYKIPQIQETNIAVQAATTCLSCFEFLVAQEFITPDGYDINGKSYLSWALERKCQPVVDYILQRCSNASLLLEAMTGDMNPLDEANPLLMVIEHRNLSGFRILIDRLAGENAEMIRTKPLLEALNRPRYKLLLCSFVPAELADSLLEALDINIGDVVYKGLKYKEEEEEELEEEEKEEEEEEEKKEEEEDMEEEEHQNDEDENNDEDGNEEKKDQKKDQAEDDEDDDEVYPVTSSWHEAARYNPDGAAFMEWLSGNSGSDVDKVRNKQGLTPLMYAAYGENASAFQWLMMNCKPSATFLSRPDSNAWPLIKIIAQNFSYDSDIMFTTLLDALPPTFYVDVEYTSEVFGFIIDGLWSRGFNPKASDPQPAFPEGRVVTMYLASKRCQDLTNRIPYEWTHSMEQQMVTARARSFGYSFLPANMIQHRSDKRRKPERLTRSEPDQVPLFPISTL